MAVDDFDSIFQDFNRGLQIHDSGYIEYQSQKLHLIVLGRTKGQGDFDGLSGRHFNDVKMANRKRTLLIGTSGDQEMDKKDGNLPMGVYPTRNRKYQAIIHFYLNLTDDFPCGLGTYSNVETASKAFQSISLRTESIDYGRA